MDAELAITWAVNVTITMMPGPIRFVEDDFGGNIHQSEGTKVEERQVGNGQTQRSNSIVSLCRQCRGEPSPSVLERSSLYRVSTVLRVFARTHP